MTPEPHEHRIGRFGFRLPATLAVQGRSQSIYRADAWTAAIATGTADSWWAAKLTTLRRARRPAGVADIVIRPLATSAPHTRGVLHYAQADTDALQTVLAMRTFDDHVALLSRQTEADGVPEIEKMVLDVIASYVPGGRSGFDIGHGTLTSVPGVNEQARMALRDAALPGFELDFSSRTVRTPEKEDPFADIEQDRQRLAATGRSLSVLRNQGRSAAGLPGREARLQLQPARADAAPAGAGSLLRFSWSFPGVPGLPTAPALMLVASAPAKDQGALEAAWDLLLGSLQLLPLAPRR